MSNTITPAKTGDTVTMNNHEVTVKEGCGDDAGSWYCATHEIGFMNNMSKDGHIAIGDHTLVWVCYTHGPETP